jgi:hypothetical protein
MDAKNALIKLDGKEFSFPIMTGTEGEKAVDARNLRKETGYIFYDQGYGNTGSCESEVTFLDGDRGILRISSSTASCRIPPSAGPSASGCATPRRSRRRCSVCSRDSRRTHPRW